MIDGTYKRDSTTEGGSEGILRAIHSLNTFMLNLSACIVFARTLSLCFSLSQWCSDLVLSACSALMLPDEQASSIICGTTETIQLALNLLKHSEWCKAKVSVPASLSLFLILLVARQ